MKNFLIKHSISNNILCMFIILITFIFIIKFASGCEVQAETKQNNNDKKESFIILEDNEINEYLEIYVIKDAKYGNEYIVAKCYHGVGITPRYKDAGILITN